MLRHTSSRLARVAAGLLITAFSVLLPYQASAHVKWFCAYDVAGQPRGLESVLCADFELLVAVALAALLLGCMLENTRLGEALLRALDSVTAGVRANTELLFRAVVGGFFVSLWTLGGIILTPELKTSSAIVPWLQLAIAAGMLSQRTLLLSAMGIAALFGLAVRDYGAFHLVDYPVFLGVAVYLAFAGLQRCPYGIRPLDVVRWTAAITLMWASVEKWAYPQWSFPLFAVRPEMTMGFDGEFFMRAAGVVEFALAFALVLTPLARRIAAIVLAGVFIGAVAEFGRIDAIGHAPIALAMLAIAADDARVGQRRWRPVYAGIGFGAALAGLLALYYGAHSAIFGSVI